jgi:hypothetical protein
MADSKNPPVLPEGYDPELEKANKGMAKYEAEQAAAQAKLAARDEKAKNMAKSLMKFGAGLLNPKKDEEPVKKAKGGSIKSASARADGCAVRGKTRA